MKKISWNKIKTTIKGYRLGDYFRQFSIVVGGIIVTFWGGDLMTEQTRQKELRSTMQLVAEELQRSRESLKNVKSLTDKDVRMSELLIEHNFVPSSIPMDSLNKYKTLFSNLTSFDYSTDALEVLKGSSLMQYISDKRMLQEILQTYYQLSRVQNDIASYYSTKSKILCDIVFTKDRAELARSSKSDDPFYVNVKFLMKQASFANFAQNVPNAIEWEILDRLDHRLEKQIHILEEKYGEDASKVK